MSAQKQKIFLGILALSAVSLFAVSMPHVTHAAGLVPCGGAAEKPCTVIDIFTLIAKVTNWLIAMAGVYAAYKIVDHGFWLVISMGNEEAITKHKSGISEAVVGFILVLIAFMLINTVVNVLLTRDISLKNNANCRLDLTNPMNYLIIDQNPCSNLPEQLLHQ
ncbi:MAG: hypothetical protein P4L74_01760 [Candidatus Doudnabacteria bacterium]|nr:hypothetical protein [Candidatus Doudnabacteria bacterium]